KGGLRDVGYFLIVRGVGLKHHGGVTGAIGLNAVNGPWPAVKVGGGVEVGLLMDGIKTHPIDHDTRGWCVDSLDAADTVQVDPSDVASGLVPVEVAGCDIHFHVERPERR